MLGFFLYITDESEKTLSKIASSDQQANGTSLADCYRKAGLGIEKWNKREVSYSMTENALLFYKDKNTLNLDQIELVLRMVRERMDVHQLHR